MSTATESRTAATRLRARGPWPALALVAYVLTIVGANWLTSQYEMVPVWFGLTATAGTYAAGLALLARDWVQDTLGWKWAVAAIAAGAALSATFSPALAVASGVAFLLAEAFDMSVYTPLRRHGWGRAALASGIVGAVVDTLVFLHLAGFPVTWPSVAGQLVGKILWATALPILAVKVFKVVRRAVSRSSVRA